MIIIILFAPTGLKILMGHDIISGLGTYFLDSREGNLSVTEISREMYVSRWLGMGHAHFRSKFLLDNYQGIFDFENVLMQHLHLHRL